MKHLAIFNQPYLNLIIEGKKTVESRFSRVRCAPFKVIKKDDIILMKKSGGLVMGEFQAGQVKTFDNLTPKEIKEIKREYREKICANDDFWREKENCHYATLIHISKVIKYDRPYSYPKKDRQGWIVIT